MRPLQRLLLTGSIVLLLALAIEAGLPDLPDAKASGSDLPDAKASGSVCEAPKGGFASEPDRLRSGIGDSQPEPDRLRSDEPFPPAATLCFWSDQGPACVERALPAVGAAGERDEAALGAALLRALLA
ncbi:MAG: hypothetical protein N2556_07415, partial [Anaerolineae bacterium]|nr:hypothetical protein [Anaerolineae bacterium]